MKAFRFGFLMCLLATTGVAEEATHSTTLHHGNIVRVDCSTGKTLASAVAKAAKRRGAVTVTFAGTCEERITIARDDFTLQGDEATSTIVGSVRVDGVSRVTLEGFTVRDTPPGVDFFDQIGDGIRVISSHKVTLRDLLVRNTGGRGVSIEESTADLFDITILESQGVGLIGTSSAVQFNGENVVSDGNITGVCAAFGSHFFFEQGSEIHVERNLFGLLSEINSTITLPNNTRVVANGNQVAGVAGSNEGIILYANAVIEAKNNGFTGILLADLSNLGPFAETTPTLKISNNGVAGVWVERSSVLELGSGTLIENNGVYGLFAEDSRVLLANTTILNHADTDVFLGFGAKASFNGGNSISSPVTCESTVMTQGDVGCTASARGTSSTASAARAAIRSLDAMRARQLTGGHSEE